MPASVLCVTVDTHDPVREAEFWAAALGYDIDRGWEKFGEVAITDPTGAGPMVLFMTVPEAKTVKNRLHLDIVGAMRMADEVDRLVALGAEVVEVRRDPEDYPEPWTWTVMLDPEGHEFCVGEQLSDRA